MSQIRLNVGKQPLSTQKRRGCTKYAAAFRDITDGRSTLLGGVAEYSDGPGQLRAPYAPTFFAAAP
jgi:hypothetical protein